VTAPGIDLNSTKLRSKSRTKKRKVGNTANEKSQLRFRNPGGQLKDSGFYSHTKSQFTLTNFFTGGPLSRTPKGRGKPRVKEK
jgi:hypothetical protein